MAIKIGGTHDAPVQAAEGNDVYADKARYRDELEKALKIIALGGRDVTILGRRIVRPEPSMLRKELEATIREMREIILVSNNKSPRWDQRVCL